MLAIDYVNFIKECWVHTSVCPIQCYLASCDVRIDTLGQPTHISPRRTSAVQQQSLSQVVYLLFALCCLYLPEPGYEQAPGEELMEWLNTHFIEPRTFQNLFILLGIFQQHPSLHLRRLTSILIPLIESQPRLVNFSAEKVFAIALRRWGERVEALRIEMNGIPEDVRFDDFENWWDRLG